MALHLSDFFTIRGLPIPGFAHKSAGIQNHLTLKLKRFISSILKYTSADLKTTDSDWYEAYFDNYWYNDNGILSDLSASFKTYDDVTYLSEYYRTFHYHFQDDDENVLLDGSLISWAWIASSISCQSIRQYTKYWHRRQNQSYFWEIEAIFIWDLATSGYR